MCYFNGKRFARRGEALGMKKRWTRSMRCVEGEGLRGARGAGVGGMAAARGGCSRVLGIYYRGQRRPRQLDACGRRSIPQDGNGFVFVHRSRQKTPLSLALLSPLSLDSLTQLTRSLFRSPFTAPSPASQPPPPSTQSQTTRHRPSHAPDCRTTSRQPHPAASPSATQPAPPTHCAPPRRP